MGLAGEAMDRARKQVTSRVPKADLDQRDPDYIRGQLPGTWLLASFYFRADVQHMDRIPAEVWAEAYGLMVSERAVAGDELPRRRGRSPRTQHRTTSAT